MPSTRRGARLKSPRTTFSPVGNRSARIWSCSTRRLAALEGSRWTRMDREVTYKHGLPPLLATVHARPTDSLTDPRRELSISLQKLHPWRRGRHRPCRPPRLLHYDQRHLPTLQPQSKTFAGTHRAEALLSIDRSDDHVALPQARAHARRPCRSERRTTSLFFVTDQLTRSTTPLVTSRRDGNSGAAAARSATSRYAGSRSVTEA